MAMAPARMQPPTTIIRILLGGRSLQFNFNTFLATEVLFAVRTISDLSLRSVNWIVYASLPICSRCNELGGS